MDTKIELQNLESYLLKKVPNQDFQRLGTTFKTRNKYYFYDTGTGKVLECSLPEYQVLKSLTEQKNYLEADVEYKKVINSIIEIVDTENILSAPIYTKFARETDETLEFVLNKNFHHIILEITQQCNFRCKYCIYHQNSTKHRGFTPKEMSWETAKSAIEYTKKRSEGIKEGITISFYGGEPLLRYDFIKRIVKYAKEIINDKKVTFAFTTNLSLMTKEKADFFAKENFTIMCSLDGPQDIHDAYRVDAGGQPTFQKALKGLKNLIDAYGELAKDKVMINTVLCPPYSNSKMNALKNFFEELDWLPEEVQKKYAYVERDTLMEKDIDFSLYPYSEKEWDCIRKYGDGYEPTVDWSIDEMIHSDDKMGVADHFNLDELVRVHNRLLLQEPYDMIRRNACCTPGGRRLYVDVDGFFSACERVGQAPRIGDITKGVDINIVKDKYIKEYEDGLIDICAHCWAANICGLCYTTGYTEKGLDVSKRKLTCDAHKEMLKNDLIKYHEVVENAPDKIAAIAATSYK